jgi:nucleotide-binding universal stress UspA family protein
MERYTSTLAPEVRARVRVQLAIGKPWEEICRIADESKADLIVVGLHHTRPIRDVFLGTTAGQLIRNGDQPVLMVRETPDGPYRRAVAATDFSPASAKALRSGLRLAPEAEFTLLHTFETPFPELIRFSSADLDAYMQPMIERARVEAEEAMDAFLTGHNARKASITPRVERDETVPGIYKVIQQQQADLLVLGTHGRAGIKAAMVGNTAQVFLNDPPCDVLVTH